MFAVEKIGHPLPLPYLAPYAHGPAILTGINVASGASGWYDLTATRFVSLSASLVCAHGSINNYSFSNGIRNLQGMHLNPSLDFESGIYMYIYVVEAQ